MAEGFKPGDEPAGFFFRVGAAFVEIGAQIGVGPAGGQDMPDDHQQGMSDGDDGFLFAAGLW